MLSRALNPAAKADLRSRHIHVKIPNVRQDFQESLWQLRFYE
jgi:hypothetical protein